MRRNWGIPVLIEPTRATAKAIRGKRKMIDSNLALLIIRRRGGIQNDKNYYNFIITNLIHFKILLLILLVLH